MEKSPAWKSHERTPGYVEQRSCPRLGREMPRTTLSNGAIGWKRLNGGRRARARAGGEEIGGGGAHQRLAQALGPVRVLEPFAGLERHQLGAVVRRDRLGRILLELALEPGREGGRRRQRHEARNARQLAR